MFNSDKAHCSNEGPGVEKHMMQGAAKWFTSLGIGAVFSLGLAQPASAVTFRTNWTGQISGYSAEGAFSYDEGQTYTDGIVRGDDLTDFDISLTSTPVPKKFCKTAFLTSLTALTLVSSDS